MEECRIKTCTIIGAGNVAVHLATALSRHCRIREVYSRNIYNALDLARRLGDGISAVDDLAKLSGGSDFYLVSVVDDAIGKVMAETTGLTDGIWAHTSGSVPIDALASKPRSGVFYPLQTFSKDKAVDMRKVPLLIEGDSAEVTGDLVSLASMISEDVKAVDSEGRRRLHVAAVFACNFANYMWVTADAVLRDSGLDISVLRPLLRETLDKIESMSPEEGQTGPARRGDFKTIDSHLSMLPPDKADIYRLLSKQIYEHYHDEQNRL